MAEQRNFSFKVWIIKSGEQIDVAFGICNRDHPLDILVGHGSYSFQCHGDEGFMYCEADNEEDELFHSGTFIVVFVDSDNMIPVFLRVDPEA